MPYEVKAMVFQPYMRLLFTTRPQIHKDRRDVMVDLKILKDLLTALEPNIAEGQRYYIQFQIAVIYAHEKLGMLLQEVDRKLKEHIIAPDNDFQKWIDQELRNENWKGYHEFVEECEPLVLKKENTRGVQVEKQTITHKDMDVVNLDDIKKQLTMYRKEVENAHKMPKDNRDCIARGPRACKFIEEIMSKLSDRCLDIPDDYDKATSLLTFRGMYITYICTVLVTK